MLNNKFLKTGLKIFTVLSIITGVETEKSFLKATWLLDIRDHNFIHVKSITIIQKNKNPSEHEGTRRQKDSYGIIRNRWTTWADLPDLSKKSKLILHKFDDNNKPKGIEEVEVAVNDDSPLLDFRTPGNHHFNFAGSKNFSQSHHWIENYSLTLAIEAGPVTLSGTKKFK